MITEEDYIPAPAADRFTSLQPTYEDTVPPEVGQASDQDADQDRKDNNSRPGEAS